MKPLVDQLRVHQEPTFGLIFTPGLNLTYYNMLFIVVFPAKIAKISETYEKDMKKNNRDQI